MIRPEPPTDPASALPDPASAPLKPASAPPDPASARQRASIPQRPASLTDRVIAFIHEVRVEDAPVMLGPWLDQAVIDTLGIAAAGLVTPLSGMVRDHAAASFAAGPGAPAARLLFDGRSVSPEGAALAGAMTIDAIDAHDTFLPAKGHIGAALLPAVLAATGAEEAGSELLARLLVGYEIGARAGIALHASAADYHTSGAWMALGCAAAVARARGLSAAATREALGIAEYHGPRSPMMRCIDHPTMLKDGAGWGAMAGVAAAGMAGRGFTGAPAATVEDPALAAHWEDLGSYWWTARQSIKPEPVCRWAQPAIHAALALVRAHGIAPEDIARVEVASFHNAIRLNHPAPQTTEQAQYSLPFPLAVALLRGAVTAADVTGAALGNPAVLAMAARIALRETPVLEARFPAARVADVTIETHDGGRVSSGPTEAHGDPERPYTAEALRAKFHAYADPVLGAGHAAEVAAAAADLATGPVAGLKALVERAPGADGAAPSASPDAALVNA